MQISWSKFACRYKAGMATSMVMGYYGQRQGLWFSSRGHVTNMFSFWEVLGLLFFISVFFFLVVFRVSFTGSKIIFLFV